MIPVKQTYHVIGTMSGSSLDGLDLVYCSMRLSPEPKFDIIAAETISYPAQIKHELQRISRSDSVLPEQTDIWFAEVMAQLISAFIQSNAIQEIDCIASHGHTTIHLPDAGITQQIGHPHTLANLLGIPVIGRFRQMDMDAGGQGAPLVPMCDAIFFAENDACLNLGGIANISYQTKQGRIGFDICGANQILNYFAQEAGFDFDENGNIAASGIPDAAVLAKLNALPFYQQSPPKSLSNAHVHDTVIAMLRNAKLSTADALATATAHIAQQIADIIRKQPDCKPMSEYTLLATGGGAWNGFLIESICRNAQVVVHVPDATIVNFKEALAIALMAVLRIENKPNFLPSVTGAGYAVCGGELAMPNK